MSGFMAQNPSCRINSIYVRSLPNIISRPKLPGININIAGSDISLISNFGDSLYLYAHQIRKQSCYCKREVSIVAYRAVGTGGPEGPSPPHTHTHTHTLFHQDENLEEQGQQQPGPVGM